MEEELKTELDKTLDTLTRRVKSCRESLKNDDTRMYKHYVNEIRFWADAVVGECFDNFIDNEEV